MEFTTVSEACVRLKIARSTLERLFDKGEITKTKVGRAVRIPTASLNAYLKRNSQSAADADASELVPNGQAA